MMGEAYGHAVTNGIVLAAGGVLLLAAAVIGLLSATGRVNPALRRELWLRLASWAVLLPLMLEWTGNLGVAIVAGAGAAWAVWALA